MSQTTNEVRNSLRSLNTVVFSTDDLSNGVRVVVPEDEIGEFYGIARRNDFDYTSKRLGETLVADIEADESGGLGDLFQ